jgi:predicted O-methyltransferase YrrM
MTVPGLPPWDAHHSLWGMDEKYRQGYVSSKHMLAQSYHPRRICEIGVYSGIAAKCFLAASPSATYLGIDNLEAQSNQGLSLVEPAIQQLRDLGYAASLLVVDSQQLTDLPDPPYDFIHVDGNHAPAAAQHDVEMAWRALTPDGVLLVDDCHNMQVVVGVAAALDPITDLLDWIYIPEGVGTMVIKRAPRVR